MFVVVDVVVVVVVSLFIASFSCCSCSTETGNRVGRIAILICGPAVLRETDIVLVRSCVCVRTRTEKLMMRN